MKKMKVLPLLVILSLFLAFPAQAAGWRTVSRCQTVPRCWIVWRDTLSRCNPFTGSCLPSPDAASPDTSVPDCPDYLDCPDCPDCLDCPSENGKTPGGIPAADNNTPTDSVPATDNDTPTDSVPVVNPGTAPERDASATNSGLSAYESEVVRLVNEIRVQYGLNTLTADADLSRVARYKSQDMVDKGYFSHTSPTYGSPFDMMKKFGISYRSAGENIAYGYATPQAVVDGWMNSSGHRANILNSSYTRIGVGYVAQGHYWTQMFIG